MLLLGSSRRHYRTRGSRFRGSCRGGNRGETSEEFHRGTGDGLERIAVFLDNRGAFGYHEEGRGTGAQVVGDSECPEGWGEEDAVAVPR